MANYQLTEKEYEQVVQLNRRNWWGFSKGMLLDLLRRYKKAYEAGDERSMAMMEERLTDANFHSYCALLEEKKFDEFKALVKEEYEEE